MRAPAEGSVVGEVAGAEDLMRHVRKTRGDKDEEDEEADMEEEEEASKEEVMEN